MLEPIFKGKGERNCMPEAEIFLVLELVKTEALVESGTLKSKLKLVLILLVSLFSDSIKQFLNNGLLIFYRKNLSILKEWQGHPAFGGTTYPYQ